MSTDNFILVSRDILAQGKSVRFTARGYSMGPVIKDGDVVTVLPAQTNCLAAGDIVLYLAGGRPLIHRIIRFIAHDKGRTAWISGDACYGKPDVVPVSDIRGKVVQRNRQGKTTNLDTIWHRMLGRIIAAASPLLNRTLPRLLRGKRLLVGLR